MLVTVLLSAMLLSAIGVATGAGQPVGVVSRTASRAGAQIQLSEAKFHYKREDDIITFGAAQSFVVPVKPEAKGVREYLACGSKRLIFASWDPSQIVELEEENNYRIMFQQLDFLVLKLKPEVDCKLLQREDAAAFISTGWRISGLEEHVSLESYQIKVRGEVRSSPPQSAMTSFRAKVEFEVSGKVPGILSGVPEGPSYMAAEQLSRALLSGAQKRFCDTLPSDYKKWSLE
ncbi:hypothetical protein T492DRAFT_932900 [Pavlovales sp. CCMP2436]|nr:hypothetical protein T492DRAFT_932900 [Pavlovales sp. CCMP2436]